MPGKPETRRTAAVNGLDSAGLSVFVRKSSDLDYSLYVPWGCFDRLFLLAFLFMAGEKVAPAEFIYSIRDRRNVEPQLPGRLRAVFAPSDSSFESDVYGLIQDYCAGGDIVPNFLTQACFTASLFLAQHECAHLLNYHFEIKRAFLEEQFPSFTFTDATLGLTKREIYEGFEVHADQEAARSVAHFIVGYVKETRDDSPSIGDFVTNCMMGLALLVSLFDSLPSGQLTNKFNWLSSIAGAELSVV